ncbi:hypothetical protein ABB37_03833 [Leptomonas pyrrhocoris]|uniref:Uncharacterized protein n=1 Tax=Leptomonas pyrrhocoris TaxID=157538 RepID=A0A0M9G3N6_LEPPY|nr:hypothetical protein ABB37_03833 [Leptomonas pyrrhocoris]KPA81476.1 hypothetical protein ABB37_03833 [Leptomonas pyrrhocoris]|eukprot:XP_015659915.1 hypothetical protein ABB37_03833 [Leptomonas pyrrhocoris]
MFGTLFFDESRVATAFRIRRTPQTTGATSAHGATASQHASSEILALSHRCAFSCRGEVALPSLRASLLWWLDTDAGVVQLLVVNDGESSQAARACQSRLLSIEVPAKHPSEVVTCGVTRNYMYDNGVAVVWVLGGGGGSALDAPQRLRQPGNCLMAGFAQITVQRDVDNTGHSSLLLVPDEQIVECAPLTRIPSEAFATSTAGCRGSACVVAELAEAASARTISLVVLTDGARLWRAELYGDGAVSVSEVGDEHRRNFLRSFCDGNEEVRLLDTRTITADLQRLSSPSADSSFQLSMSDASAPDPSSPSSSPPNRRWIRRFLGNSTNDGDALLSGDAAGSLPDVGLPVTIKRRLYAAVSAIQLSPFIALTRWNGQVEIYDVAGGALQLAPQYPIGVLPHAALRSVTDYADVRPPAKSGKTKQQGPQNRINALPAGATAQWATRDPRTQLVHVITCLGDDGEGRPCLWTSLPPLPPTTNLDGAVQDHAGEILAQHCTVSVAPPTLASTPLACAVTANGGRLILVCDIGSEEDGHLLCSRSLGALTLRGDSSDSVGVATVVQVVEAEVNDGGLHGLLRTSRLHGYLCQGVRMQGVVTRGEAVVLVGRGLQPCRLFTMEDAAADALMQITEGVVVGVEVEDVYGISMAGRSPSYGNQDAPELVTAGSGAGSGTLGCPPRVHYVPLVEAPPQSQPPLFSFVESAGDPFAVYWEGVDVIQSCAHGARLMAELLADVLQSTTPVTEMASLPRFLSEAHLSGYTASLQRGAPTTRASVLAAVQLALNPSSCSCRSSDERRASPAFYEYSRLYVTQAAMGKLLSRLTFLTTTYLGWQSTQSVAVAPTLSTAQSGDAGPSADWFTQQLVTALEVLVAAYHAVPSAGSDIVQMAPVADDGTQPTSASIMAALLPSVSCDVSAASCATRSLSVVQVVNRLRRCGTPRMACACTAWVKQLTHRFPLLQHYQLLSLLDTAAAPTQSARVQACCERVCQALARETADDVVNLLFLEGLFLLDVGGTGSGSAFRALPLEEIVAFLSAEPAMGPKLYAVGVLRRVTGLGALYTSLNTTVTRHYLHAMLVACDEAAERLQRRASARSTAVLQLPFQHLRRAFAELQVDVLLTAAQARVSQADMAGSFHDLQTALDLMLRYKCLPIYAEVVQLILSSTVEVACASQANMRALLRATTIGAAQLDESLILKWYNYVARLPTKSASEATEALRYRAIMGLHRYLMNHHSYAQCAHLMSSLATLIRCSPLRRSAATGISVSELAGLALHAASRIAPSVPMPESGRPAGDLAGGAMTAAATSTATTSQSTSPTAVMTGSPLSLGYSWQPASLSASPLPTDPAKVAAAETSATAAATGTARWLTRADIPWLQRRLYQAQCERQLWRRGCTLDCTDLWVEGAPVDAYRAGVEKLVCALMQTRLWPQAFRFACLSEVYDACGVLEEWAVDLLQGAQRSRDRALDEASAGAQQADRTAAWEELIRYCGELSTLENQFSGFVRTVTTALTCAYEAVPAELLAAHRVTDAYTAMSTLFRVALVLRRRADDAAQGSLRDDEEGAGKDEDTDETQNGATSSSDSSEERGGSASAANKTPATTAAVVAATRRDVWRALSAAARIGLEILENPADSRAARTRGRVTGNEEEETVQRHVRSLLPLTSPVASAARRDFSPFTAGVLDPMAVCATELLRTPAYRDALPSVPGAQENVDRFLNGINAPWGGGRQ